MFSKTNTFFFLLSVVFLSGCTFGGEKTDFVSLYTAHVSQQMDTLRDIADTMGYMESYQANGSISMGVDIPAILSGAIRATYDAKVHGQDVEFHVQDTSLRYETLLASGSFLADSLDMISQGGDAFFRFDGVESLGLFGPEIVPVLEKYKNTWLAVTKTEFENSLSGSTTEDRIAYEISDALGRMTLTDMEDYLTRYPLWKEEKSLGMSGGLTVFEVSLSRENIRAMVSEFAKKASGTDLTPEQQTSLEKSLQDMTLSGTMAFDTKDAKRVAFSGILTAIDGTSMNLSYSIGEENLDISIGSSGSLLTWSSKKMPTGYDFTLIVMSSGVESARISGNIGIDEKKLTSLSITFSAPDQGLTVTLNHTNNKDGTFSGVLNAGVGNMDWNGKTENTSLKELHVNGAMIGSNLSIDLTPGADGFLTGSLIVKSGDVVAIAANLGLKLSHEEFSLRVDMPSPDDATIVSHAEMSILGNRSPWKGIIETPKDTKNFQDFSTEISNLSQKDESPFLEEDMLDTENTQNIQ